MFEFILERGFYWAIIGLMMIGLYIAFSATNLIKRLVGLSTFQTSILLFYVSLSRIDGGTAPILMGSDYKEKHGDAAKQGIEASLTAADAAHDAAGQGLQYVYSNPLPHVLMLTAIVVGVATLAVGLALIVRIREAYGTIEVDEIRKMDLDVAIAQAEDERRETLAAQGGGIA